MPPNSTIGLAGRFGNHVIRNLYASFLAEAGNVKFIYSYDEEIKKLGIPLFRNGTNTYEKYLIIHDDFCLNLLDAKVDYNIFVDICSAQNHEFASKLFNYFRTKEIQSSIMKANMFAKRYDNNSDVFVHVRLGDVVKLNPGYDYYDSALSKCCVKGGFISSDSPNHPIVLVLAAKYNLELFEANEVETIMMASTCKNLILSAGTFSWLIGALGFFSKVYVPHSRFINKWCGPIFDMPEWMVVDTAEY